MQNLENIPDLYYSLLKSKIIVYNQRKAKVNSILKKKYPDKEIIYSKIFEKVYTRFLNFVTTYNLFKEKEKVCVAWSGGKDSTALLILLEPLARVLNLEVEVVTVDIRPNGISIWSTEEFKRMVKFYSSQLPFRFTVLGPRSFFAEKSICYLCSALRREELTNYCRSRGFAKLVLAHTLDDVIETIFIMAYKAKKLKLMSPMKFLGAKEMEIRGYRVTWSSIILVKPLLNVCELDIQEFLEAASLPYYQDKLYCPYSSLRERTLRGKVDKLVKKMYEIDRDYLYRFLESLNKSLK